MFHDCPMSTCAASAGSPCRAGTGKVAIQNDTRPLPPRAPTRQGAQRVDPKAGLGLD
ncbi:hypothetical protein [Streptomyces decoyicus]|uniref:hypothetical protein n=1 Tax=Streptomyces decoyicus TaxID=249567 RepID=UPI003C12B86F